jgi:hypothetical protein
MANSSWTVCMIWSFIEFASCFADPEISRHLAWYFEYTLSNVYAIIVSGCVCDSKEADVKQLKRPVWTRFVLRVDILTSKLSFSGLCIFKAVI